MPHAAVSSPVQPPPGRYWVNFTDWIQLSQRDQGRLRAALREQGLQLTFHPVDAQPAFTASLERRP